MAGMNFVGERLNTEIVKRYIQEQGEEKERRLSISLPFFPSRYSAACCDWVIHLELILLVNFILLKVLFLL